MRIIQPLAASVLVLCAFAETNAHAQAWVADENSLSLSLAYSFSPASKVVETDGQAIEDVHAVVHMMTLAAEYTPPLPGLAIMAQLPIMGVTYDPASGRSHGAFDDGGFHVTPQDLRIGARYMLLDDPVAFTLGVAGSIPVANYPVTGFTAPGRHLKALYLNAAAGMLMPFLPQLFVHATYELSLPENASVTGFPEVSQISQFASTITTMIGYYILPELEANVGFDLRIGHDGINFADYGHIPAIYEDAHELVLKESATLLGGGIQYSITEDFTASFDFRLFLGGTNTRNGQLFALSLTYTVL